MFSKKATEINKIFTDDLTLCSKCQMDGEYFINFCGCLRKHELYLPEMVFSKNKDTLNIPDDSVSNVVWSPSTPLFSKTPKSSLVKGQKISKGKCGV